MSDFNWNCCEVDYYCMLTSLYSVKANQESPLLRLPPEIRNRIWAYALGGKVIRQVFTRRKCVLLPKPQERINAFTLLAACRQIYVETAVLPFAANTVSIRSCYWLSVERRRLRIGLRSQITELSVEISTSRLVKSGGAIESIEVTKLALFPGLKRVRFCLFPVEDWQNISCPEGETLLRSLFEQELSANGYGMLVEKMDMSLSEFIQRYFLDAHQPRVAGLWANTVLGGKAMRRSSPADALQHNIAQYCGSAGHSPAQRYSSL
jgi:hypothetical protein